MARFGRKVDLQVAVRRQTREGSVLFRSRRLRPDPSLLPRRSFCELLPRPTRLHWPLYLLRPSLCQLTLYQR